MAETALATKDIHALLDRKDVAIELRKALPKHLTPERLIRIAATAIQKSPGLKKCTPLSLLACVVECGQLGLEPDGVLGDIYLVPFKDQATIIVGYKGFAKLAFQTGDIFSITTHVVRKGERFSVNYGTHPRLVHTPDNRVEGEKDDSTWLGVYAIAHFRSGHTDFEWLVKSDVYKRRSRSQAFNQGKKDSPWFTNEEAMWKKSAIRALANRLPKSTTDNRLARAVALDEMSELGLVSATTTGLEISEDAASLNAETPAEEIRQSTEVSNEEEKQEKRPAGGSKKSKKAEAGNPLVPKAQIPRDPIDVKAKDVTNSAKADPFITRDELGKIYQVGANSGSWNVDSIRDWVKKKFNCKVAELKKSQLPEVMRVMDSGE